MEGTVEAQDGQVRCTGQLLRHGALQVGRLRRLAATLLRHVSNEGLLQCILVRGRTVHHGLNVT